MNISIYQIKAARALLDWTQDDLAKFSGLSKPSIQNYESKKTIPNSVSILKIIKAFESHNIKFLDNDGVKRAHKTILEYEGVEGFGAFIEDVYQTVKHGNTSICINNVDEKKFEEYGESYKEMHFKRMKAIPNLDFKVLTRQGDQHLIAKEYVEYRWVKKEDFLHVPLYVYDDKVALIFFKEDNLKIYLIHSADIANAQREQFLLQWNKAIVPTS